MKSCWKEAYHEKKFAKHMMRKMKRKSWSKRTVYKCDDCWFYHLSSCDNEYLSELRKSKINLKNNWE